MQEALLQELVSISYIFLKSFDVRRELAQAGKL